MGPWLIQVFRKMGVPRWERVDGVMGQQDAVGCKQQQPVFVDGRRGPLWLRLEKGDNTTQYHQKLMFLCLEGGSL